MSQELNQELWLYSLPTQQLPVDFTLPEQPERMVPFEEWPLHTLAIVQQQPDGGCELLRVVLTSLVQPPIVLDVALRTGCANGWWRFVGFVPMGVGIVQPQLRLTPPCIHGATVHGGVCANIRGVCAPMGVGAPLMPAGLLV